jgi:hypothetical protein
MKRKKRNILKRNSGFIVGCVLVAGASFATSDTLMERGVSFLTPSTETSQTDTVETIASETSINKVYETDPFTVTASGNIIKGAETEAEKQTDENGNLAAETSGTDEYGNTVSSGSGDSTSGDDTGSSGSSTSGYSTGSAGGSSSTDDAGNSSVSNSAGSSESGSGSNVENGSGDTSGYNGNEQPITIYDTGNGSYYYTDTWTSGSSSGSSGSASGSNSGSSSSVSGSSSGSSSSAPGNSSSSGSASGSSSSSSSASGSSSSSGSTSGSSSSSSSLSSGSTSQGNSYTEPSDVILPGISTHYIDESELYNYSAAQIRLIRNEIFALHGRMFNSQDLMDYFSQKSWYVPRYTPEEFDAHMFEYLNDYEAANLKVILNYEEALAGN